MEASCELSEKTPIHLKFSTFVGLASTLFGIAFAVAVGYVMLQAQQKTLDERKPLVDQIPVIESNIATIKDDLSDIKGDIKILLQKK